MCPRLIFGMRIGVGGLSSSEFSILLSIVELSEVSTRSSEAQSVVVSSFSVSVLVTDSTLLIGSVGWFVLVSDG